MLLREIEHQGSLPREVQQMNPYKVMEDPARGRVLHWLTFVVRNCRVMVLQGFAKARLQRHIDQQTYRHHHQQGHDPLRLFEIERRGQQEGIFEEATAAFCMRLAFVACEELLGRSRGVVECIGGKDDTTLLLHERLTSRAPKGEGPCNMVDHVGGGSAWLGRPRMPSRGVGPMVLSESKVACTPCAKVASVCRASASQAKAVPHSVVKALMSWSLCVRRCVTTVRCA